MGLAKLPNFFIFEYLSEKEAEIKNREIKKESVDINNYK